MIDKARLDDYLHAAAMPLTSDAAERRLHAAWHALTAEECCRVEAIYMTAAPWGRLRRQRAPALDSPEPAS